MFLRSKYFHSCRNFVHTFISLFSSLAAPGETVEIAEEMAARDALRRIFRTDEARPMLPMGDQASPVFKLHYSVYRVL